MASKFNNSTAQNKWDSLKGSAGVSLSHIVQGKASSSDFQRVQNVLNQQSSLASQIFKQAVSAAEAQAKKFQSSYQAVLDKDNKQLLSAFEVALNVELQKVTPDIIGQLKEIIEMSASSHSEELDKSIGSRFEAFKEFLPKEKDVPSMHDILDANTKQAAEIHSDALVRWEHQEPALLEKIAGVFQTTLRSLADTINREKAQRSQGAHGGERRLANPHGHGPLLLGAPSAQPSTEHESILSRGMSLVNGPAGEAEGVDAKDGGGSSKSVGGSSTMVVALSPSAQRELTTAAKSQTDFYDRVKALLPSAGAPGKGDAEEEGDEEKKADTWWRSFKEWFGDDESSSKSKKGGDNSKLGWLKTLGSALALMVLNPKLFKTIGDEMKKFLTWDNLSKSFEAAWKWVSDKASSIVDTITTMLSPENLKKAASALWGFIKKSASAIGGWIKKLLGGGDDDAADNTSAGATPAAKGKAGDTSGAPGAKKGDKKDSPSMLSKAGSAIYSFFGGDSKKSDTTTNNSSSTSTSSPNTSSNTSSTVVNASMNAGKSRSSVGGSSVPTAPSVSGPSTYAESDSVRNSPGTTTAIGGNTSSTLTGGSAASQPQRGAPQIGIGSFGFNASNSDSLTLMNTYHFTTG
jgi:hypothetical protein